MKNYGLQKWFAIFFLVLLLNTAYVAAFSFATVFYMTNVLVHLVLGLVLSVAAVKSRPPPVRALFWPRLRSPPRLRAVPR